LKKKYSQELFDLSGRTIILTGSAGRLGTQYAHILSEAGANVVLVDMDRKRNEVLKNDLIKKYNTNPSSYTTNIANELAVKAVKLLQKKVLKKYNRIDVLINNAFFNPSINQKQTTIKFETFPLKIWEKVIDVNLTGVFLCCREFGKVMAEQNRGVIINISSIYGMVGADQRIYGNSRLNSQVSYATTKGAIMSLTRYLAAYWHRRDVRVNTLTLGGVMDKSYMKDKFIKNYSYRTMLGRMADKNDYNGALLFLVSDASSYMTGANVVVDGGLTAW
jgi:NAD(P)-dependent dehydrogenase (short-subunit alcohol dehydrogenase family)